MKDGQSHDVVIKVFQSSDVSLRDNESRVLSALLVNSTQFSEIGLHVPQVLHTCLSNSGKPIIILDKIGCPLQSIARGCGSIQLCTLPIWLFVYSGHRSRVKDFSPLVQVVQLAHSLGIFHRDISIANIFYHVDSSRIFLNDWSSAHHSTAVPLLL